MTDPVTAGLMSCVDLNHDFVGAEAIGKLAAKAPARRRVGLILETNDNADVDVVDSEDLGDLMTAPGEGIIPTLGTPIATNDSREIGSITSGTFSPALGKIIAMGYVASDVADVDTELIVQTPNSTPARVTSLPFVSRCV